MDVANKAKAFAFKEGLLNCCVIPKFNYRSLKRRLILQKTSELKSQHELKLTRQTGTGIGGSSVVVVVVEIIRGVDDAEGCGSHQVARALPRRIHKGEIARVWIAKLNMVEDVEGLDSEFHANAFSELGFLGEREINLPGIQGPDQAVRFVAEAREVSIGINRRGLERGRINQGHAVVAAARQYQWHTRNDVGTLAVLIVAVGKQVSIRKARKRPGRNVPT